MLAIIFQNGKDRNIEKTLEIEVNNITPTCVTIMEPFYYVNQQQIGTIKMGTTQMIKANKPPMNTYVKSEMLLHSRMSMDQNCTVIEKELL